MKNIFKRKRPSNTLRVVIHPHTQNRYEFVMCAGDTANIPIGDKVWFGEWMPHDEPVLFIHVMSADDVKKKMKELNEQHVAREILKMDKMRPPAVDEKRE